MARIDEDEVLAQRARRGEPAAFAMVATRWWPSLYRIALNMLGTESEAAAASRMALLLVLGFPGTFACDVPFRTSLYGAAIDVVRLRRRSRTESLDACAPRFDEHGRLLPAGEDCSGLLEALRLRPVEGQLRRMLGRLDGLDRAAFVLREIEELPVEEVAVILRLTPVEVRAHAHRAIVLMSGLLGRMSAAATVTANLQ